MNLYDFFAEIVAKTHRRNATGPRHGTAAAELHVTRFDKGYSGSDTEIDWSVRSSGVEILAGRANREYRILYAHIDTSAPFGEIDRIRAIVAEAQEQGRALQLEAANA